MANEKRLGLIDRKRALEMLCQYCMCGCYESCQERCVEFRNISNLPTVDAVEVVHGRWEYDCACEPYCSNCGSYALQLGFEKEKSNYCPNCGADMRERKDND